MRSIAMQIGGRYVRWVQQRATWVVGVIGLLVALGIVYVFPLFVVPERGLDAESRLNAENDVRATMVQALGGAVLLGGTALTLHITRQGQITDRFSRAIEHLGHTDDKLDIRLGGIYALERIARESPSDQGPIADVLTAFLRRHARWDDPDRPCRTCNLEHARSHPDLARPSSSHSPWEPGSQPERLPQTRADFQAVATVLARNQWSIGRPFALGHVDLHGVRLPGAHFQGADLHRANLQGADLQGAHLEGASLEGARLEGANLRDAHLGPNPGGFYGASLVSARLERATLDGANLEGALLAGANLDRALLTGANLERALLLEASLKDAAFKKADLQHLDLSPDQLEQIVVIDAALRQYEESAARDETPGPSDNEAH